MRLFQLKLRVSYTGVTFGTLLMVSLPRVLSFVTCQDFGLDAFKTPKAVTF